MLRSMPTPRGHNPLRTSEKAALVAEVLTTYCVVRWTMRGNDLPDAVARLRGQMDRAAPARAKVAAENAAALDDPHAASRLGYVVSSVLRLLPTDSRCLMRSLVLTRLLARRGLPSSLVIGVVAAPEFAAHAWVEHAGRPLLPAYEYMFARLVEL